MVHLMILANLSRASMGQDSSSAENKDDMINDQEDSANILEGLRLVRENARILTASVEEMKGKPST